MNQERMIYLAVKDTVDNLPERDRLRVQVIAQDIRDRIEDDNGHGMMAVALVCAELNAGVKK